ncbi:response regulator [Bradyrhizobium sp. CSA207]|uniref:response regulator n=1 Tax=Bradyrhizobium sp. CSA207 TaxID=2698826 RepID=UPI0023B18F03|nr:response regulator transcription factor [Bradyrhizobium sp. CSA207]MDE5445663.1 response regulator [Bradyrhizobium sp. CSA207]
MMGFLIIDDHPLFGEALGNAIRISHPDARIFEAASIRQALSILATERNIDLALLDLLLPDAVGSSGFLRLRGSHPKLPILIVSSVEDKPTIREALAMGAVGYLSKSTSVGELSNAIARILSGSVSAPKAYAAAGTTVQTEAALREKIRKLTPQQVRVLHLLRNGLQNREIATELKLAESTVKAHVTEILRKLGLFSRNKAIIEIGKIAWPSPAPCQSARGERERPS